MKTQLTKLGLALVTACFVAGCATPRMAQTARKMEDRMVEAEQNLGKMAAQPEGYFTEVDEDWFGDEAIPLVQEESQPEFLRSPMMFRRTYPVSLQMVAEYVTTTFGVPVDVSADALEAAAANNYDAAAAITGRLGAGAQQGLFTIQYEGTLKGFLDQVAARTGNSWRYTKDRIALFNLETRTFTLHAIPGTTSVESTITNAGGSAQGGGAGGAGGAGGGGGAGGEGGSGGTSSTSTSMSSEFEIFETAAKAIESMLGPKGKIAVTPATGNITVTDVPGSVERVALYVDDLNTRLKRQIAIDVKVYNVEFEDNDAYGINWNAVWQTMTSKYQLGFDMTTNIPAGAGNLGINVIDEDSNFAGSSALVEALSEQGNLTVTTTASVVTMNNQPVPVQVAEQTAYVPSATTTLAEGGFAQTTITTATLTTGFSMNVLPIVIDKNEMLMQLSLNLSTLRGIRTIGTGETQVEAPQVDSRQFLQRVRIGSGNMLVLSGFEQERLRSDLRGIGDPGFTLAGGSKQSERRRSVLVITLTPRILG